jgi:hypothetical protein
MRAKNTRNDWIIEECPTVPRFIQVRGYFPSPPLVTDQASPVFLLVDFPVHPWQHGVLISHPSSICEISS